MTLANSHLIALAEDAGFKRCYPQKGFGDASPRWEKGGGLWEEKDLVSFMRQKVTTDTTLRLRAASFSK
jgi:hypothetical protein